MGQYYNIIIQEKGKKKIEAYDRHIDGKYTAAKLIEHSWYLNGMVNAVAQLLRNAPSRIAWVGDYAEDVNKELYEKAWGEGIKYEMLHSTDFTLNGKYIVNHTKKEYVDCWKYLQTCMRDKRSEGGWVMHPLPLLVAVGNGNGGGDYNTEGCCADKIGRWAWDVIEIIEDYQKHIELKNAGYTELEVEFYDC